MLTMHRTIYLMVRFHTAYGIVSSASSGAGAHRDTIIAGAIIVHARRAARTSNQVFASVADQQLALVAVLHEAIVATVARS